MITILKKIAHQSENKKRHLISSVVKKTNTKRMVE